MKPTTKEQYDKILRRFFDDSTDYLNVDGIVNTIHNLSNSYQKCIVSSILYKLRDIKDVPEDILKRYEYIVGWLSHKCEYENQNHKNIHGIIPKWDDIIKIRDNLDHSTVDYTLLCVYTYIAPRRLEDYKQMIIGNGTDMNHNYYRDDSFVFNKYKTDATYGTQIIKLPQTLVEILDDYIDNNHLDDGNLLFGFDSTRQIYRKLNKLLKCSVDNIRHSYINKLYEKYNIPSSGEIEKQAFNMAHSVEQHLRYRKFD